MKNNKGMTLIEVVVSLLILSTASLIMAMGFTTAINTFTDANAYKNAVNENNKVLETDATEGTNVSINKKSAKYSITVKNGEAPIEVKGELKKATNQSTKDVTLSSFVNGKPDETSKAYNVYDNYCTMMENLYDYLQQHKTWNDDAPMNDSKIKQAINAWLKEQGIQTKVNDIITNLPALYNVLYDGTEINDLKDEIEKVNSSFKGDTKDKYCNIVPCLFYKEQPDYTAFFMLGGYKKDVYILIGDKGSKGDRPSKIYAIYDNVVGNKKRQDKDDNSYDVWWIPKEAYSIDKSNMPSYEDFYNTISTNGNWVKYTTTKQ